MQNAYKDLVSAAEIRRPTLHPDAGPGCRHRDLPDGPPQGHGDKDKGGMIRVFEELLGVRYRSGPPE